MKSSWASLLAAGRPRGAEVGIYALVLAAIAAGVFGSHVVHGGFYYDDWADAALTRYSGGLWGTLQASWQITADRPVLVAYLPLTHWALGVHPSLHLAWAVLTAVVMSTGIYAVLRNFEVERLHAALVGALVLVFPFSDATRLWSTASLAQVAVCFYLGGVLVALRGLGATRSRWLHATALTLYALSIGTYEVTVPLVAFSGALYLLRTGRPGWRRAAVRWAADLVLVAVVVAIVRSVGGTARQPSLPLSGAIDHAGQIADDALTLLTSAALPFGSPRRVIVLSLLAVVAGGAVLAWRLLPAAEPARATLARWLGLGLAGVVVTVAGYAPFIPADPYYSPLVAGVGNRINIVAGIGFVLALYAPAGAVGTLLFRGLSHWRRWTAGVAATAAVFLGWGYYDRLAADKSSYRAAARMERGFLDGLRRTLPRPSPGTTLFALGSPAWAAPGVPAFASSWDLNGAVKLEYDDGSLIAYPLIAPTRFVCAAAGVYPLGGGYDRAQIAPYGRAVVVDVRSNAVHAVTSAQSCQREVAGLAP